MHPPVWTVPWAYSLPDTNCCVRTALRRSKWCTKIASIAKVGNRKTQHQIIGKQKQAYLLQPVHQNLLIAALVQAAFLALCTQFRDSHIREIRNVRHLQGLWHDRSKLMRHDVAKTRWNVNWISNPPLQAHHRKRRNGLTFGRFTASTDL